MPLTLVNYTDGDGDEINCPMFLCDQCGDPVQALGGPRRGLVLWHPKVIDGVEVVGPIYYVHQGDCDHRFSTSHDGYLWSRELSEYLTQLTYNTTNAPLPPGRKHR